MKLGINAISTSGLYGMPEDHMAALQQVANDQDMVLGFRPVSKYALTFILLGCPTKTFHIKNKSSNLGPMAGLIAINPKYSRVALHDYDEHHKLLKEAFEADADLKCIPLVLNETRLQELSQIFQSAITIQKTSSLPNTYQIQWEKDGVKLSATAIENKEKGNFYLYDEHNLPIEVLGRIINTKNGALNLPITADYDLLVVCPTYAALDFGNVDKRPFRTQGLLKSALKRNQSLVDISKSNLDGPKEHPDGGNWSPRIERVVKDLNQEIKKVDELRRTQSCDTIHHNDEFNNPYATDLKNNLPSLLLLPAKLKDQLGDTIILIETIEEMIMVRKIIRENGYYWPSHSKYNDHIKPFESDTIKIISELLESMKISVNKQKPDIKKSEEKPCSTVITEILPPPNVSAPTNTPMMTPTPPTAKAEKAEKKAEKTVDISSLGFFNPKSGMFESILPHQMCHTAFGEASNTAKKFKPKS